MKDIIEKFAADHPSPAAVAPAIRALAGKDGSSVTVSFTPVPTGSSDVITVDGVGTFSIDRKAPRPGRLSGKVAVVTGSAQGFGEGIAEGMTAEGCYMVIADLNINLAQTVAARLNEKYGEGTAIAVKVNVADEESVREMTETAVLRYGSIDILVSNAGVVRAGGLEEMTVKDFSFVTDINYLAYFLCAKYASRSMKITAMFDEDKWSDIIQINSKSGLEGSNKNFAYAGSKFGGIGLTESFALELVTDNIKVNSICPGNYYDGPLWSDPEKGLFVSYLRAGKIPGAQTVEDVRQFYLSKSPIRRGCTPDDVTKAILYCVEQKYETGQAIPVTGGQKMLK
ncbi:MAG: SDR family NAD(P)-dependent oxidoreductase [Eubacteriales bacterium]|jgi:NAD(P)-dependent dehydrogenase (short-subunit alcohol dehydrogenase family)|nr:SDR family NAD(P)-dependent oxidoreductase [Eubacteriales bacterium]MDD4326594.1 SDR family NAD(P)-dependent oxidoreductase [Eubacteriales bacterium]MDD4716524.1 SDR family NAD(P)-dependent oxidoreductase [Eubacteriales bacterium]NCU26116.1 SDR family NAD(P)-dependent oxidoreductase [Candidatus Nomurabacteria bacterium]